MARRSRGGRRGRNRGITTVRLAPYSMPVQEPCNFLEEDFSLNLDTTGGTGDSISLTYDQILAALPAGQVVKMRVTSVVIDPPTCFISGADSQTYVPNFPYEAYLFNGVHYEPADSNMPLRIRLGKDFGDAGMWLRANGGTTFPEGAIPGIPGATPGSSANFLRLRLPNNVTATAGTAQWDVHVRIAWQDTDATA